MITMNFQEFVKKIPSKTHAIREKLHAWHASAHHAIPFETICLHYINGDLFEVLTKPASIDIDQNHHDFIEFPFNSECTDQNIAHLQDPRIQSLLWSVTIQPNQIAVILRYQKIFAIKNIPGTYYFWNNQQAFDAQIYTLNDPDTAEIIYQQFYGQQADIDEQYNRIFDTQTIHANEIVLHIVDDSLTEVITTPKSIHYSRHLAMHQWLVFDKSINTSLQLDDKERALVPFLNHELLTPFITSCEIHYGEIALRYAHGNLIGFHDSPETLYFWNFDNNCTIQKYQLNTCEIPNEMAQMWEESSCPWIWNFTSNLVNANQIGILSNGHEIVNIYQPGKYAFWNKYIEDKNLCFKKFSTKPVSFAVKGQEILTKDKACVKLDCTGAYIIDDIQKCYDANPDLYTVDQSEACNCIKNSFYESIQLILRDYVASHTIDEILNARKEFSEYLLTSLQNMEQEFGIHFEKAAVRDIKLNAALQDIMNQVLIAEKHTQVRAIERRDENAANRSLQNFAKMMDENKTMLVLKKLDSIEKICAHAPNLNISLNSPDHQE